MGKNLLRSSGTVGEDFLVNNYELQQGTRRLSETMIKSEQDLRRIADSLEQIAKTQSK